MLLTHSSQLILRGGAEATNWCEGLANWCHFVLGQVLLLTGGSKLEFRWHINLDGKRIRVYFTCLWNFLFLLPWMWQKLSIILSVHVTDDGVQDPWRNLRRATSKHATLEYWLFGAKGTWKTAGTQRALCPPFSSWKQEINCHVKDALPVPGRKKHSYHRRRGIESEKNLYGLVKITHLPLVSPYILVTFP